MSHLTLQEKLRRLPGVDELLTEPPLREALRRHPRKLLVASVREVLDAKRQRILALAGASERIDLRPAHLVELVLERLEELSRHTLRPVVNATGVVIHTNLGRSLLPEDAIERIRLLCAAYNNLEYDLEKGRRGSRYVHAESILREITGAEAALVVNNNAGAVFLALSTLAKGREVIVSRGQLVEIGGAFRIPDVMSHSGAVLREVGCTNRTHPRDYEGAIGEETALLLKVHCSNYRVVGFTAEVSLEDLVRLGREHRLPVMEDLGSGSFVDLSRFGLAGEPTVQDAVKAGADLVTFSGDKLLGGPQAGIVVGRKDLVERCKKNPVTRALRVDKTTLAALESTLRLYRDERTALERIPTLRMIALSAADLERKAHDLASMIRRSDPDSLLHVEVRPGFSRVGGGSLPEQQLPTFVVGLSSSALSVNGIESFMRSRRPPVIGRIESDAFLLDPRTLQAGDDEIVEGAVRDLCRSDHATMQVGPR